MATIADMKKQEREKKKNSKGKEKKVKTLLSKNINDRKTVSSENLAQLEVLLERVLKPAKLERFKYSWSELKKIPKEKRRQSRNALMIGVDKERYQVSKKIRDNFIIGTNRVIRSLEKEKVLCGFVSTDFDPIMIVDHIVSLSKQKRVPVILLPQLKSICERCLGFSVKALGIKKKESTLEDSIYKSLLNEVLSLSDLSEADVPPEPIKPQFSVPATIKEVEPEEPVLRNFILKRPNAESRCFVPDSSASIVNTNNSDFISLGSSAVSKQPLMESKIVAPQDEDDSDSDPGVGAAVPKLKPYVPMFQSLKLKKIKPKN